MTEPGYVAPAAPGWWVRTNRVGTNVNGINWDVAAVGGRDSLGSAAGVYGWAGAAVGRKPLQFAVNVVTSASVTIPTHAVGDLIIIHAYAANSGVNINAPAAGGTVPTWTHIDHPTGSDSNASATAYCIATATNHTSGTWASTFTTAVVIKGHNPVTPIGGHTESGSAVAGSAVAPAITMSATDGSSGLLHFMGHRISSGFTAWATPPAGYTQRSTLVSGGAGVVFITKNATTSDGAVTNTNNGTSSSGYRGATVEILR